MIPGVAITVDREAVVVRADEPLTVLSSAVVAGGLNMARAIMNLHVPRAFRYEDSEPVLAEFARCRGLAPPWVGLLTAAWTEKAEVADDACGALSAVAIATVGLSNVLGAGRGRPTEWAPSTINTIVVVDAAPEPAALVNLVLTITEAKTLALAEAGVRASDGGLASGTSTDAVAVAATGRGLSVRFGGPLSELGALVARVAKRTLDAGIRRWRLEHP
ncbi:MAG: adenosylcobinamide amidohydrolase [Candidatus Rokuibacteriota bacterium]